MNVISFFSGCGGLDLGFERAGFKVLWANDNAQSISRTYRKNFPSTTLSIKDIKQIEISEIPTKIDGIIGGPPCQSWSNAGKGLGFNDPRGEVFKTFIEILDKIKPKFFVAENVKGIMAARNKEAFDEICQLFDSIGYDLNVECLNAADYDVPQNRERVFFVGFRKDLKISYVFPQRCNTVRTVREAIEDINKDAVRAGEKTSINAHEYWVGGYSYIFMSRNRVLDWDSPAFTIQASGRQTSIHPSVPKMKKIEKDVCEFAKGYENQYRRLTARECARIQTFPDSFQFIYTNLNDVYKMIGNAVPVNLAYHIARSIKSAFVK